MIGAAPMSTPARPQGPIFVGSESRSFDVVCDWCVREKNYPDNPTRGSAADEELDDVRVRGELPLGEDRATVTCPHGHEHVVLREGSDAARDFRQ
jgi:hypothetical protein